MAVIEFGSYTPDIPAVRNTGATTATNVNPFPWGYRQQKALSAFSDALAGRARGFISADTAASVWYGYAGTGTTLEMLAATTWADAKTGLSLAATDVWEFIKWDTQVFAATISAAVQEDTIGVGTFADLITSTRLPKAKHLGVVGNHLVLGNISEASWGTVPNRIAWSATGVPEDFDPDVTTGAGFEDLEGSGGVVQKIIGGPHGIIFKQREIWLMTFEGPPVLFRFDNITQNQGAIAANSVIRVGDYIYFLDREGYMRMPYAGGRPESLCFGRTALKIISELDEASLDRMSVMYDAATKSILWGRPRMSGNPDRIDVYNINANEWSVIEQEHQWLAGDRSRGFNIDTAPMASWDLDVDTFDLDDPAYKGGAIQVGAFNSANKLGYFNGSAMAAVLETGETQPLNPKRTYINGVRPLVTGTTAVPTVQVGTRELQTDSVTWSTAESVNTNGIAEVRANARYMRFRVNITGGFDDALGVEIDPKPAGMR